MGKAFEQYKVNELNDKSEVLDMRLEELGNLVDVLSTYTTYEDDNNNIALGSALSFVAWSINQLRVQYSEPMIKLSLESSKEDVK